MGKDPDSGDESNLFREAMADTRRDRRAYGNHKHLPHEHRSKPQATTRGGYRKEASGYESPARPVAVDRTDNGESILFYRAGVAKPELRNLQRNEHPRIPELDLHGDTLDQAMIKLERFVEESLEFGETVIRVIPGKGLHSGNTGAVLRKHTVAQLKRDPRVRAFCAAPASRGGSGALHVFLVTTES